MEKPIHLYTDLLAKRASTPRRVVHVVHLCMQQWPRFRQSAAFWARCMVSLAAALLFLLPLYWAMVASLRLPGLPPPLTVAWWPQMPQWDNYARLFHLLPMTRYLMNSLLVVAVAVPVTLVTASQAGFAMAQLPPALRRLLMLTSVAFLMIPGAAVWLFRFQVLRWLGLLDTVGALIAPAFAGSSPLFILLFYWSFRALPAETFEAAALDGAGAWTIWSRLALPMTRPAVVTVVVLTFALYWSDFISPVLYIYDPEVYTLAVGLQLLKQLDPTNWPLLMAAAVGMTLPVLLLFALLQRFFLHSLTLVNLLDVN